MRQLVEWICPLMKPGLISEVLYNVFSWDVWQHREQFGWLSKACVSFLKRYLKIQVFWDVTQCHIVNNYQNSEWGSAYIFRVKTVHHGAGIPSKFWCVLWSGGKEIYTVERRLSERQSSETSNVWTHIFFVLRSNNEKSAITSHNKVLCHFY